MRPHPGRSRVGFVRTLSLCLVLATLAPLLALSPVSAQEATPTTPATSTTDPVAQPAPVADTPPGPAAGTELTELRTANSKTYATDDPRNLQADVYNRRIHYRDAQGKLQDRDDRLIPDETAAPGTRWRNAADEYTFSLASRNDDPQLVRFDLAPGLSVAWSLQGAGPGTAAAPTDASMTWTGALPNVNVQVDAAAEGIKETLVLSSPKAQDTFVYPLQLQGLTPELTPEGAVVLKDAAGTEQARIEKGVMWDSTPEEPAYSSAVTYSLITVDGQPALQVSVDRAWLSAPKRVYPVFVDPNLSRTTTFGTGGLDTYVKQGDTVSHGTDKDMYSGTALDTTSGLRALIKFDLTNTALEDKTINWAELKLWNNATWNCTAEETDLYVNNSTWGDTTLWPGPTVEQDTTATPVVDKKYDVAFFANGTRADPTGGSCNGTTGAWTPAWRVTNPVRRWIQGGTTNFGFQLRGAVNLVNFRRKYVTKDCNSTQTCTYPLNWPTLTINYSNPFLGALPYYSTDGGQLSDRQGLSVNLTSGNALVSAADLTVTGPAGLNLPVNRFYNARSDRPGGKCAICGDTAKDFMGYGWSLDTGNTVRLGRHAGWAGDMLFEGPSGYRVWFTTTNYGDTYTAPPGVQAVLTRDKDNISGNRLDRWHLKFNDSGLDYLFDLTTENDTDAVDEIADIHGNKIDYLYNTTGTDIGKLSDAVVKQADGTEWGRVTLAYDTTTGLVSTITQKDANGTPVRSVQYTWQNGFLDTSITPNEQTRLLQSVKLKDSSGNVLEQTDYVNDTSHNILTAVRTYKDNPVVTGTGYKETLLQYEGYPTYPNPTASRNKATQITWADGTTSSYDYTHNRSGTTCTSCTTVTNQRGNKSTSTFDSMGRQISFEDAKGVIQTASFQAAAPADPTLATSTKDRQQGTSTFAFNADSMMTSATLPTAAADSATYTSGGPKYRPATYTSSQGKTLSYTWDTTNQRDLNTIKDSNNATLADIHYTACGDIDYVLDGRGKRTEFSDLDPVPNTSNYWCRPTSVDPQGPVSATTTAYDTQGRVTSVINGNNNKTSYTYDALDRVTRTEYRTSASDQNPASSIDYTYDGHGNLIKRVDSASGVTTGYLYDARSRRCWDAKAAVTQTSDCVTSTPPTGTLVYKWDGDSNLIQLNDGWGTTAYAYDEVDQVTSITLPDPTKVITYSYCDPNVYGTSCTTGTPIPTNYKYKKISFPNGAYTLVRSDDSGRVSQVTNGNSSTTFSDLTYDYHDPTRTGTPDTRFRYTITNAVGNTTLSYRYNDPQGRITSSSGPNENFTYGYDLASNLTSINNGTTTTNFVYDDSNEQCWKGTTTPPADCTNPTFTYDGSGNLRTSTDNSLILEYNARGQTTRIKDGTPDRTAAYDGNSQMERTAAGSATFVNSILGVDKRVSSTDEVADTPNTIDTSGTTFYIRDPGGGVLGQYRQTDASYGYFGGDALGSVRHVTDGSGTLKNSYSFGPYGETVASTENMYVPWRFTGQYDDDPAAGNGPPNALYKMGARYYQPGAGRWTQRDPLNRIASMGGSANANPYAYSGCNPANSVDPSGMKETPGDPAFQRDFDIVLCIYSILGAAVAVDSIIQGIESIAGGAALAFEVPPLGAAVIAFGVAQTSISSFGLYLASRNIEKRCNPSR